ncbi:hypothetical protein CLAFUW4_01071 [Fulvia fulva]|uniref:BHLH domain-containing protein n=1 Tax=Passalora fulva TaxID=5499 RepID=A0A9Q8L852_PASFU|nr:uncharacterized protein CLAFUR5_01076 [Fulvia fulva]KAK4634379.1 hypothetical protein CLAFUR4_01072 [Fulvia fulva]KAK4636783.1 hypothetical protein CLAFUR0_01073 [Fulvia fulva]UJO12589.1 hypothetical protein CLAFUR5_01076 [Fulvia fulva]WPV09354.1 hypothetical protein CLAFUW4_01071 [Fulvia fulva]WPV23332.1 hypothetical protein CLAFUW7_01076 [Fulvia fulva]
MPRPNPPPTPGSSSDIRAKEKSNQAAPVPTFNLPQTAFSEADRRSPSSTTPSANGSDSSYRPVSPTSPVDTTRKRPAPQSGPVITKDDFTLPPPPTRSRKIIQMKPRELEQQEATPAVSAPQTAAKAQPQAAPTGSKRKQNNAGTTAAGRKIARKTAHSLIERRRRSKMNEEFGVLKDMIPACKGQEMHKLAILQASVEYLRYLEQCVSDLQAQHNSPRPPPPTARQADDLDDDDDEDEEMEDDQDARDGAATPATTVPQKSASMVSLPSLSQITTTTTTSPSVFSMGAGRHYSISSAASSYSPYLHSNQASPAFGPQLHHVSVAPPFGNAFGLGSPALKPVDSASQLRHIAEGATELSEKQRPTSNAGRREQELDQEATAALLMLNHDRRNWRNTSDAPSNRSNTGMSVRDLLSG